MIKKLKEIFSKCNVFPATTDIHNPTNPNNIPPIFLGSILILKTSIPTIMVNNGVSELSIPAKALSIFVSAMQNK